MYKTNTYIPTQVFYKFNVKSSYGKAWGMLTYLVFLSLFVGMSSSRQFLRIKNDKELLHRYGDIPYMTISYTVNYKLHFCYYTPLGFGESLESRSTYMYIIKYVT